MNSLLNEIKEENEKDNSCDVITGYYQSPITHQPVTGVEALSTILSNSDELQNKLLPGTHTIGAGSTPPF